MYYMFVCLHVSECNWEKNLGIMEDYDDNDISWLTQVQSLESQKAQFSLLSEENSDEDFCDLFGRNEQVHENIVSLEENNDKVHHLYDDVVAEDISSDEEIDTL